MNIRVALPFILTLLLLAKVAFAGSQLHEACLDLCEENNECAKKCANHAELFEIKPDFVQACAEFHSSVEIRMKALRTGASLQALTLCKDTGWSLDNVITCMRSYPTPELIKECKKITRNEDGQVQCLRLGRTSAQVEACFNFGENSEQRFACLSRDLTAQDTRDCQRRYQKRSEQLSCLDKFVKARDEDSNRFQSEVKARVLAEENELRAKQQNGRLPASTKKPKNRK